METISKIEWNTEWDQSRPVPKKGKFVFRLRFLIKEFACAVR